MSRKIFSLILLLGFSNIGTANAADVTANVTLQRGHIIERSDIDVSSEAASESLVRDYVGQEMQRTVYAGARLSLSHVDKPTLVKRNEQINMIYRVGRLEMTASGRALGEGGDGDIISVMNLDSKRRVQGLIRADGSVEVTK